MTQYRKKLGKWGEELAREYFQKRGYEIVEQNWQKRSGEIDLIARKDEEIVFVEVKTRTTPFGGYGEEAVNKSKKQKIKKTLDRFLRENMEYQQYRPRVDILVIEIFSLTPKFIHFEDVEM